MSPEQDNGGKTIYNSEEKVRRSMPYPDLPVVLSPVSADHKGKLSCDGGPELPGKRQLNGKMEDILRAIGPVLIGNDSYGVGQGPESFKVTLTPISPHKFIEDNMHHTNIKPLFGIGPQELPLDEEGKPLFRRAEVRLWGPDIQTFIDLLDPETEFERIIGKNGDIVIVKL